MKEKNKWHACPGPGSDQEDEGGSGAVLGGEGGWKRRGEEEEGTATKFISSELRARWSENQHICTILLPF